MSARELLQQNSKNWRRFVIEDDRVIILSKTEGMEHKTILPFDAGVVSLDYDETIMRERLLTGALVGILMAVFLVAMFGSFALFAQEKNQTLIGLGILLLAGSMTGIITLAVKSQPRTIKAIRVYVGNGSLYFYGRNEQDRDQVKAFISHLLEAQRVYFRKKYLVFTRNRSRDA